MSESTTPTEVKNASVVTSTSASSTTPTSSTSSSSNTQPTAINGVPIEFGNAVPSHLQKQLQRQINTLLGWGVTEQAPMNISTMLNSSTMNGISEAATYYVCEKSSGIRNLALLLQGHCYLITPNYNIREVPLFCPVRPDRLQPGVDRSTVVHHQWTILDGEMVNDKDTGGKSNFKFLIHDILALNGRPVMSLQLPDRLKAIQNDVVAPRMKIPLPSGHPPQLFQLSLQSMYPMNKVNHIIRNIIPRLSRKNIGLAFTSLSSGYIPGASKGLYHWTLPSHTTVDFQLGVEWRGRPPKPFFKLLVRDKRTIVFNDWITFSPEEYETFRKDKKANSRIVQCRYSADWLTFVPTNENNSSDIGNSDYNHPERGIGWRVGGWKFVVVRPDISVPFDTVQLATTEKSFEDSIKLEDFEVFFPEDPAKAAAQARSRKEAAAQQEAVKRQAEEKAHAIKRKRSGAPQRLGVCYDFQNKGNCKRGLNCHFSHCACDTNCTCTIEQNTYGQRPYFRRDELDESPNSTSPSNSPMKSDISDIQDFPGGGLDSNRSSIGSNEPKDHHGDNQIAVDRETKPLKRRRVSDDQYLLESFDRNAVMEKLKFLSKAENDRIWKSMVGSHLNKDKSKKCLLGFNVFANSSKVLK